MLAFLMMMNEGSVVSLTRHQHDMVDPFELQRFVDSSKHDPINLKGKAELVRDALSQRIHFP